jgi:hypothetical protein
VFSHHIPSGYAYPFVFQRFDIEPNRRNGCQDISALQLVEGCRSSTPIYSQEQSSSFLSRKLFLCKKKNSSHPATNEKPVANLFAKQRKHVGDHLGHVVASENEKKNKQTTWKRKEKKG